MNTQNLDTLPVTASAFVDFCNQLQDGFEKGYRLDLETNENYPWSYSTQFHCVLVKGVNEAVEESGATADSKPKVRKQKE